MRTYKSLATEMGISERQFHRRLDAKDQDAMLLLRQEVLQENSVPLQILRDSLFEHSDSLARCNPDLAQSAEKLGEEIASLLKNTPRSKWWCDIEQRQAKALEDDEAWQAIEDEISANTNKRR